MPPSTVVGIVGRAGLLTASEWSRQRSTQRGPQPGKSITREVRQSVPHTQHGRHASAR
ncbi:hypothetical protein [Streptomyces canus]|uniref:hypothetical protein n=1 Tax=Streptomyces canus TaxID=58343 RepID=UPI00324F29C1